MPPVADESPPRRYRIHGLRLASWLDFPELEPAPAQAGIDVRLRLGQIPAEYRLDGVGFAGGEGWLLLGLPGIARFLVRGGEEIIVEPETGAGIAESDLRVLVLSSPMGALLHQRGVLPLHASAVATPRGAVVFLGHSGRGKSALAAQAVRHGWRLLSDDITAVQLAAGTTPHVQPGSARIQVWPDLLEQVPALGTIGPIERRRAGSGKLSIDGTAMFERKAVPLVAACVLHEHESPDIRLTPLSYAERFQILREHTYRAEFAVVLGRQRFLAQQGADVAATIPITRLQRPWNALGRLPELIECIAGDLGR